MVQGGRREEGSGWGTRVYLWWIHVDIWQIFSNKSTLRMRWPNCWSFSFSISPSNEQSGLISFWIDWFYLLEEQGTLKESSSAHI